VPPQGLLQASVSHTSTRWCREGAPGFMLHRRSAVGPWFFTSSSISEPLAAGADAIAIYAGLLSPTFTCARRKQAHASASTQHASLLAGRCCDGAAGLWAQEGRLAPARTGRALCSRPRAPRCPGAAAPGPQPPCGCRPRGTAATPARRPSPRTHGRAACAQRPAAAGAARRRTGARPARARPAAAAAGPPARPAHAARPPWRAARPSQRLGRASAAHMPRCRARGVPGVPLPQIILGRSQARLLPGASLSRLHSLPPN